MASSRKNKTVYIDAEALSTLALIQAGMLAPVTGLMSRKEADEVDKNRIYKGIPFPFSLLFAPSGKRNASTIKTLEIGETVDLISQGGKVGEMVIKEVFEIDQKARLMNIYGTNDSSHPGVKNTMRRLGKLSIYGDYKVEYPLIQNTINRIGQIVQRSGASKISSMMMAANPLNRAHERMIRQAASESDLLIIFLRKPFTDEGLRYDIRLKALNIFVEGFLPKNKVLIIPFENTYIFAGYNELILEALLAKNSGCNELLIGKNHAGLGLYYDKNKLSTVFDTLKNLGIKIKTIDEYVYCDTCRTLVSTYTCPHGQHHHVHYHSASILALVKKGIIPPTILVRKEVSSTIIAELFPDRFDNIQELYYSLMPSSGLLEKIDDEQFYSKLMELYQTSSLT
jgi:sulfate adenylyltransferase